MQKNKYLLYYWNQSATYVRVPYLIGVGGWAVDEDGVPGPVHHQAAARGGERLMSCAYYVV